MTTEELIAAFNAKGGEVTRCPVEMPLHMRFGQTRASNERRYEFRRDKRPAARQPANIVVRDRLKAPDELPASAQPSLRDPH